MLRIRAEKCALRGSQTRGFPRSTAKGKSAHGFRSGDFVAATVAEGKCKGSHVGRVGGRSNGAFKLGRVEGINWRKCRIVQRADGYHYAFQSNWRGRLSHSR